MRIEAGDRIARQVSEKGELSISGGEHLSNAAKEQRLNPVIVAIVDLSGGLHRPLRVIEVLE
jgi:hypothetical protein